jgi:CRISPR-associated exonuclease Cas4
MTEDAKITGTLVWYYAICPRECWLMAHQLEPERDFDLLAEGRLNTEAHYAREAKEITLPGGVRVDKVRREDGKLVLSEIKKSSRFLPAAKLQLAYYLWVLEQEGVYAEGEVLVPEERQREEVRLEGETRRELQTVMSAIQGLVVQPGPPEAKWLHYCKTCAYAEFCWSGGDGSEA